MAVGEGKFVLYSRIEPPLPAGDYRITATQKLGAETSTGALDESALPTRSLPTHVRVRSPRFALPPDQVLSTFPPANSTGSFGMRLAQIVIKRRTLPWERLVAPDKTNATPWLALVLIAEGEAELHTNQPAADCVTPGVVLDGEPDVEKGHYLLVRRSMVEKIFPTQLDVPLLAHAREVDISDTELMMGDDDGFLAVVVSNRLPVTGRDADGKEVPVKYLACLINLEGQFPKLLPKAPSPPLVFTAYADVRATLAVDLAASDQLAMGRVPAGLAATTSATPIAKLAAAAPGGAQAARAVSPSAPVAAASATATGGAAQWSSAATHGTAADVYVDMARPFGKSFVDGMINFDPVYRFPVLLYWSFTSSGETTFQKLMQDLDAGLLGTVGETAEPSDSEVGRPPVEVVETGHVGLVQRTRVGDQVRAWYRGPFVPHPTADPPGGRLPLAHVSDQLRVVVPDGREDLSLASAFEIGRLLALSRPTVVAALMRWRQGHYQTARREAIWAEVADFLSTLSVKGIDANIGVALGRGLAQKIAGDPDTFLGAPRALVNPGRPLGMTGGVVKQLAQGLGLDAGVFDGPPTSILDRLRSTTPPVVPAPLTVAQIGGGRAGEVLGGALDQQLVGLLADAIPGSVAGVGLGGGAFGGSLDSRPIVTGGVVGRVLNKDLGKVVLGSPAKPDALDRLVDDLRPGRASRKKKEQP
jgi:hypothetical protein